LDAMLLLESVAVVSLLSVIALRLRVLDIAGTALAALLGLIVYWAFGRGGFLVLALFVVVAGITTKFGYMKKSLKGGAEPRMGLRGWRNVAGNGLLAALIALAQLMSPEPNEVLVSSYLGAVSAVFGDTMATEVGLLSRGQPRLILGLGRVQPGTPGGVTLLGYLGALSSGIVLSGATIALGALNPMSRSLSIPVAIGGAIVGTTVDSLVGQLFQAIYACDGCGALTEHSLHCGRKGRLVKGYRIVGNQFVNFVASLSGASWGLAVVLAS